MPSSSLLFSLFHMHPCPQALCLHYEHFHLWLRESWSLQYIYVNTKAGPMKRLWRRFPSQGTHSVGRNYVSYNHFSETLTQQISKQCYCVPRLCLAGVHHSNDTPSTSYPILCKLTAGYYYKCKNSLFSGEYCCLWPPSEVSSYGMRDQTLARDQFHGAVFESIEWPENGLHTTWRWSPHLQINSMFPFPSRLC